MTLPVLKVLSVLLEASGAEVYGLDIMDRARLSSGTAYPVLRRLESAGWLTSRWENADPASIGRPRRRYYQLTAEGATQAGRALATVSEIAERGRVRPRPAIGMAT